MSDVRCLGCADYKSLEYICYMMGIRCFMWSNRKQLSMFLKLRMFTMDISIDGLLMDVACYDLIMNAISKWIDCKH